jgi:predicted N-acyltransferase
LPNIKANYTNMTAYLVMFIEQYSGQPIARGLLPITTHSAHWLAHPQFADAVDRFLEREGAGIENYVEHLEGRNPFRV